MLDALANKNILLLQGPVGPFFYRLAKDLEARGVTVTKINFNAGDAVFYPRLGALFYRGSLDEWPAYLEKVVAERAIDAVLLFGDCRPIHKAARAVLKEKGIPVYVFEEGYLRPHFITVEPEGVNGHSTMPKDPEFYRNAHAPTPPKVKEVEGPFTPFALYSVSYALAHSAFFWAYPKYRHHRSLNIVREGYNWAKSGLRKAKYRIQEQDIQTRLENELSGKYFLAALQVSIDSQIEHTAFGDITEFIEQTVASFAAHASKEHFLVVKHHPLDRAYRDYTELLYGLRKKHNLGDRLIYVHDLHLPTLLKNAKGTVMMNSTVGMSSLHHGTPVKLLGRAVYDLPGLTFQGSLDEFWTADASIDKKLLRDFIRWLRSSNQPNGSFYVRLPAAQNEAGVHWPQDSFSFNRYASRSNP